MILFLLSFVPGVGPLLAFAGRNPWVKHALDVAAGVLLALALVVGFAVHERHVGRDAVQKAQAQAIAAAEARNARATLAATQQRQADAAQVAATEQELSHADDSAPDSRPSPARRAYLCGVLRHQSGGASKLPADCGPGAPAGAAARR